MRTTAKFNVLPEEIDVNMVSVSRKRDRQTSVIPDRVEATCRRIYGPGYRRAPERSECSDSERHAGTPANVGDVPKSEEGEGKNTDIHAGEETAVQFSRFAAQMKAVVTCP